MRRPLTGRSQEITGTGEEEGTMAEIHWLRDVDAALEQAKREGKPVLVDFTAAPA